MIGIFDSGLGGLTVVRELRRRLPDLGFVYVADTAHVPYGPRPAHEILAFARGIVAELHRQGADTIVAACNMSSALALPRLTREECPIPIFGMIRPGIDAALRAWRDGPLGILATEGTVRSEAYPNGVAAARPGLPVVQSACPSFVPLVEAGQTDTPDARKAAGVHLAPLLDAGCRTIVLGCTHYPWLLPVLRDAAGPGVQFIDPAREVVDLLARREADLSMNGTNSPADRVISCRFAATAEPERLDAGVRRWLHQDARTELWDLWTRRDSRPVARNAILTLPLPTG